MVTVMTVKYGLFLKAVRRALRRSKVMPRTGGYERKSEQRVGTSATLPYTSSPCPWASAFSSAYSFLYLAFRLAKRMAAP